MLKDNELDIDKRFIEAVIFLENNGTIKSRTELSGVLDYSRQSISEIMSGRTKINMYKLRTFCNHYKISLQWIMNGVGNILSEPEKTPVVTIHNGNNNGLNLNQNYVSMSDCKKDVERMAEKIASLEKEIQLKDKIISLLENK